MWETQVQSLGREALEKGMATHSSIFAATPPPPKKINIQAYAPTSNAEEAEVEWFYEDLQDLLTLTPQKDVLFIIGDWNAIIVKKHLE